MINNKELFLKPPVVVVLGHVDHGKTSLLDYIRKTNIAEKETGKITQHIGACEVEFRDKKITFIDTPGHEAFSQMRSCGAQVADMALVVIAANEGIKPQTKEVLKQIQEIKLPYIIVINKSDLLDQNGNLQRIEKQLQEENVQTESWGGDVPLVKTSAKTGEGIDELLDTILILGELLTNDKKIEQSKDNKFIGVVIETNISENKGIGAIFLVREGEIMLGDVIESKNQSIKIKKILDWQNKAIKKAVASQPIQILGFKNVPEIGEIFKDFSTENSKAFSTNQNDFKCKDLRICNFDTATEEERLKREIRLIVKTDVYGSQSAIIKTLEIISKELEVCFVVIKQSLGNISESDLKLSQSTKANILGFRIKTPGNLINVADRMKVRLLLCDIIYNIKSLIEDLIKENPEEQNRKTKGKLEILAIFRKKSAGEKKKTANKIILGGKIIEGELMRGSFVEIQRNNQTIGEGKVLEIEKGRQSAAKVIKDEECGVLYEGNGEVKVGDLMIIF
ncbi:MAG: translation initiation factor IF-2 [Candidatus Paceibacterota bacterium]|jgi:translation initiation factor IF-2